jgi:hypothetical protein
MKVGQRLNLTDHRRRKAIRRCDHGEETLAEIERSYNVSGCVISRLDGRQ